MDVEREVAHRVAAVKLAQELRQQIIALQTEEEQAAAALKLEFSSYKLEVGPLALPLPLPLPLPRALASLTCSFEFLSETAFPCPCIFFKTLARHCCVVCLCFAALRCAVLCHHLSSSYIA